jgi:hypothetical protein
MPRERKIMISARVPASLVARLDFVVRNTEGDATRNRSVTLQLALETWLEDEEARLEARGVRSKKADR